MAEGKRGDMDPDGQSTRSPGSSQFEGTEALEGAAERGVLAHAPTQAQREGGIGEVEVEPVGVDLQAV
jgi:hypothetical protein